jgi:F-box-like
MRDDDDGISILSVGDEIIAEIFAYLGATDTARCASVCQNWNLVCRNSRSLWRRFVCDDYYLARQEGGESADWYAIYAYIRTLQIEGHKRQKENIVNNTETPLATQLVFSDDGSPQPGNPPENALINNRECFCTNAFVDKNVDLVASLSQPCLITHFLVANEGYYYTSPVKETLAFASMDMPDLDAAREFDGEKGSEWVRNLFHKVANKEEGYPIRTGYPKQPLAGFLFPGMPFAFNMALKQACTPVVARFVHFKLLSSSHCQDRVSNNIDVCRLQAFGIALPRLPELLQQTTASSGATSLAYDPSSPRTTTRIATTHYQRRHQSVVNIATNNLPPLVGATDCQESHARASLSLRALFC